MEKARRVKSLSRVAQVGRVGQVGWLGMDKAVSRFAGVASLLVAITFVASRTVIAQTQPPQEPRFQSSVEVTSLDISVVDDRGKPIEGLTPADFTVRVDGNPRRVVTAEWVPLAPPAASRFRRRPTATAPTKGARAGG
jgi:hypothetical protein